MADAAVEFLLNNLTDLVRYHSDLISGAKREIESLKMDLELFDAFLKDSLKRQRKDDVTKALVKNIRNVVYDMEDAIDVFVTQAIERSQSRGLSKLWRPTLSLHSTGKTAEALKVRVEEAKARYVTFRPVDDDKNKNEKPEAQIRRPRLSNVVGFQDVTEELIRRLTKETDFFDVVSLIGMFGLGKTTLAWKVFNDPAILYKFPVRIWLVVSQDFSDKDIFLAILKEFTTVDDGIRQLDYMVIAGMVAEYLINTENFLIIMDDVWSILDWDRLRLAIPNVNNKGKVLITSF